MKTLDQLIAEWQAGTLSPEDLDALKQLLANPAARRELLDEWLLDETLYDTLRPEMLSEEATSAPEASSLGSASARSSLVPRRLFPWLVWREARVSLWPLAAVVVFACLLFLGFRYHAGHSPVGKLAQSDGLATVERQGKRFTPTFDEPLLPGDTVHFAPEATGQVLLTLGAGATHLALAPGTDLTFENPWRGTRLLLSDGTLTAAVAHQPRWRPLKVTTPQATATVLGTQFSLSVTGEVTRLSVLEGAVRLARKAEGPAGSAREVTVHAGETAAAAPTTRLEVALLTGFLSTDRWRAPANTTLAEAVQAGVPAEAPGTPPAGTVLVERLRGYLVAPVTGEYTFWVASLHGGRPVELWLSPDEQPAHKRRLAWDIPTAGNGGASARLQSSVRTRFAKAMEADWRRSPSQKSGPCSLAGGKRYYIEILHEGEGIDSLAVGWTMPGQGNTAGPVMVDINALCPFVPAPRGNR